MPFTEPTTLPEFASEVNPVGDPSRIVEPSGAKKLIGWAARERPPRNWMNWLHNLYYNWIGWLSEERNRINTLLSNYDKIVETGTFDALFTDAAGTGTVTMTFNYTRSQFGIIRLSWNFCTGMFDELVHYAADTPLPVTIRPVGVAWVPVVTIKSGGGGGSLLGAISLIGSGGISFRELAGIEQTNGLYAGAGIIYKVSA